MVVFVCVSGKDFGKMKKAEENGSAFRERLETLRVHHSLGYGPSLEEVQL